MGVMSFFGLAEAKQDNRRVAARIEAFGSVKIDSKTYPLVNWSATGLLISGHDDHVAKGQLCSLEVSVSDKAKPVAFSCRAGVVRVQGDRVALQFQHLNKVHKQAILNYFNTR